MADSHEDVIEETQMMPQHCDSLQARSTGVSDNSQTHYEAHMILENYKGVADRINDTFRQLENQREAIKRQRETTKSFIRSREEILSRLEEAKKAALDGEKSFLTAETEFLRAKEDMIESHRKKIQKFLQVELIDNQLKDVDAQISSSKDRVEKQMEEMRRLGNEKSSLPG